MPEKSEIAKFIQLYVQLGIDSQSDYESLEAEIKKTLPTGVIQNMVLNELKNRKDEFDT